MIRNFLAALAVLFVASAGTASAGEVYGDPSAPLAGEVLGLEIHTSNPEELQYVIVGRLMDQFARDQGIEVGQDEIDAYVKSLNQSAKEGRIEVEKRRAELEEKLKSKELTGEERDSATEELDSLKKMMKYADAAHHGADDAFDEVARSFIRQWKINQSLYRRYGGRVIFQQGGPEPLDAYRQFLEEQQKKGAFRILKKELEPEFWRYYVTDSIHDFIPKGSDEEKQAMETPWWLQAEKEKTE